ncbi:MAG: prepilin peptidase [Candidatus Bathyarchaeia archaeon]
MLIVDVVKLSVGLTFLMWASYHDLKAREVPNTVWSVFLPTAAGLTVFESYTLGSPTEINLLKLASAGASIGLFVAISYLGFYGGADSKALTGLALLFPLPPASLNPPLGYVIIVFPLVIFFNSLLISLAAIPYVVFSNLRWRHKTSIGLFDGYRKESLLRKAAAIALCKKIRSVEVKPYDMLAEEPHSDSCDSQRKLVLFRRVDESYQLPRAEEIPQYVFVSAALPMLVFITLGFLTSLIFGDILFWLITLLARVI